MKDQEHCEKQKQLNLKGTSEAQGRNDELEQVRALLLAKDIALQNVESDRLHLSKQLEETQEEIKFLIKEIEEPRSTKEALHIESEQQECIKELGTKVSLWLLMWGAAWSEMAGAAPLRYVCVTTSHIHTHTHTQRHTTIENELNFLSWRDSSVILFKGCWFDSHNLCCSSQLSYL